MAPLSVFRQSDSIAFPHRYGVNTPRGGGLATTDSLLQEQRCEPDVAALRDALAKWPGGPGSGERKLRVLDARLLAVALQRLDVVAR